MLKKLEKCAISFQYPLLVALVIVVVISKVRLNGLVHGLDYGLFQPDGAYYALYSYQLAGAPSPDSVQKVLDWYAKYSLKHDAIAASTLSNYSGDIWQAIYPRILYPLLSVPFLKIFGMTGMLAIPILSLFITTIFIQKMFGLKNLNFIGLLVNFILLTSPTFLRWMTVNYSDSLLVAIFSVMSYQLLKKGSLKSFTLLNLFCLILLSTQTRFCLPIWILLGLYQVYIKFWKTGYFIILFSFICTIPALLLAPPSALLPSQSTASFNEKIMSLPISIMKTMGFEFLQLLLIDRLLLLVTAVFTIYALSNVATESSKVYLFVFIGCIFIGGLNGVLGVNFRYYLPIIPFGICQMLSNRRPK
jgi:hypothetical protein